MWLDCDFCLFLFFFNDTATTEIYTLSLHDALPFYRYALEGDGVRAAASALTSPTLLLKRGEPVSITVVNELPEATAVHWHGIELESYFDGVADYSGHARHVAKAIAPGDSFVARFTPPRSGT